jgi:hypothetical protein
VAGVHQAVGCTTTASRLVEHFECGLDAPIWLTWELTCVPVQLAPAGTAAR